MASPIYGTQAANYMNILAGQARGMNEAERLRRMQEQQDFSRAYDMLQYQDRLGAREQQRQDQYSWNAYNANVAQNRMNQQYQWNAYNAERQQEQQDYNRGRQSQTDTLRDISTMQSLGYDPTELLKSYTGARYGEGNINLRPMVQPQRQLKPEDATEIARLQRSSLAGDREAATALDLLGRTVPQGPNPYQEASSLYNQMPSGSTWDEYIPFVGMAKRERRINFLNKFGQEVDNLERRIQNGTATQKERERFNLLAERAKRYISGSGPNLDVLD